MKNQSFDRCIFILKVLYSCKNFEQLDAWMNWVRGLKIDSISRITILGAAEDYIESKLKKFEVRAHG